MALVERCEDVSPLSFSPARAALLQSPRPPARFSVDLVAAAVRQRQLLRAVHLFPCGVLSFDGHAPLLT